MSRSQHWGLSLFFVAASAVGQNDERVLQLANGESVRYSVLEQAAPSQPSARETALRLLRHLAAGEIEDAAALSNSPRRRYEVLRDYMAQVGEVEFKQVFAQYFSPQNRLIAEIAIGPRRLLIWDLGETGHHLGAQYYVEVEGKFLMDDAPGEERSRLRQVLDAYRSRNARSDEATASGRTD